MPKKTRKEKLLARYHNKIRSLEDKNIVKPQAQVAELPQEDLKVKIVTSKDSIDAEKYKASNKYFFSDLRKSLFLIALILSLEVSLYFAKLIK